MWVAHLRADVAEIEELRVAFERGFEIGCRFVLLRREHPRIGHGKPERLHRAVRRLLFHRLDGPRVVQHVEAIHENGFLYPLTARVVPVRDSIEHDVVTRALLQSEGLDTHALDFEAHRVTLNRDAGVPPSENLFEADRPTEVRAKRETNPARGHQAVYGISFQSPVSSS